MNTATDSNTEQAKEATETAVVSPGDAAESVFPLPLTPFERYMLADDRPGYPMTFLARFRFEGEFDRTAIEGAFSDALQRHPLLSARLVRRGRVHLWESTDDPPPTLKWKASAEDCKLHPGAAIDLFNSPGIAAEAFADDGYSEIRLLCHHAATDGLGAIKFCGDVMAYYACRQSPETELPRFLIVQPSNLAHRGSFDIRVPAPVSRWDVIKSTIREGWRVMSRRPLAIHTRNRPPKDQRVNRPNVVSRVLPASTYGRYCEAAAAANVNVNDLLLRDLFLTIDAWNREQGLRKNKGWIRITIPTSLRGKRDSRMPAANLLGYALVTHHTKTFDAPEQLLKNIAAETTAIRDWSLGALFVEGIRAALKIPGLVRFGTRFSRRFSTAVLSNLSDSPRRWRVRFPQTSERLDIGNVTYLETIGAPPIRPGTRIAMGLSTHANQLTITANADPRWFDKPLALEFVDAYVRYMEKSCEAIPPCGETEAS